MILKRLLALAGIFCALTMGAHAQIPVAFIGGSVTYNWANSAVFAPASSAYKWESYGFKVFDGVGICRETGLALQVLQGIIASGKKPVIHLLVGTDEAVSTDDANPVSDVLEGFEHCFAQIITTAQNANLKVVVGTSPYVIFNSIDPYNKFIFAYCATRGIPVIDYYTLLLRANENFEGTQYLIPATPTDFLPAITTKGYALMNAQADRVIAEYVGGVKVKAGYLGNEALQRNGSPPFVPQTGMNAVAPGTELHWYAYGQYSDGITVPIANANVLHEYGTWSTSNPEVISIAPDGTAWALQPGTANIHFTTLSGATINEWVMNVTHSEHN